MTKQNTVKKLLTSLTFFCIAYALHATETDSKTAATIPWQPSIAEYIKLLEEQMPGKCLPTVLCGIIAKYVIEKWKLQKQLTFMNQSKVQAFSHIPYKNTIIGVSASQDTSNQQFTILLWRPSDGAVHTTLTQLYGPVKTLAYSKQHRTLISGSMDSTIGLWSINHTDLSHSYCHKRISTGAPITAVAMSPDETRFAAASSKSTVSVWKLPFGEKLQTYTIDSGDTKNLRLAWNCDGTLLVATLKPKMYIWDATKKNPPINLQVEGLGMACSPSENQCVVSSKNAEALDIINFQDRTTATQQLRIPALSAQNSAWYPDIRLAYSPSGSHIALLSHYFCPTKKCFSLLTLWNAENGMVLAQFPGNKSHGSIHFVSDYHLFVSGDKPGTVIVYSNTDEEL